MRKLMAKQKKLLKQEWNRLKSIGKAYPKVEDIPYDLYDAIDSINYCEIFYQNVSRFFDDLNREELIRRQKSYDMWEELDLDS